MIGLRVPPRFYYDASPCFHYYHHYICIFLWLTVFSLLIFLYGCHSVLWLYKLGLDGASIVPARPAFKLKSDYQQHDQVHPGMFVCLETAGIHITHGLQLQSASDVDHYVAAATRTLISSHLKSEAPVCDKWWCCAACVTSLPLTCHC